MNAQHIYVVILAGGSGTRLWPLSRKHHPKQLISLNGKSLLEQTIDRASTLSSNIFISTTHSLLPLFEPFLKKYQLNVIEEPIARNTAASILLACHTIYQQDPHAFIVFLPADHVIEPVGLFTSTLQQAIVRAQEEKVLTLIGIKPTSPSAHYGYIEYEPLNHRVLRFHEKPEKQKAEEYLKNPHIIWNSGIFCAFAHTFLTAYKEIAPDFYTTFLKPGYESLPAISFDHLILEKTKNCQVVSAHFVWSDIGTLESFCAAIKDDIQPAVALDSCNNIIIGTKKMVSLLGVQNLCIIETDDILFIADRTATRDIPHLLHQLSKHGYEEYQ
jgi:mannose-1-phosphate guanylyltransferase